MWETSQNGSGVTSWNRDYSDFPRTSTPFTSRGGYYHGGTNAGCFYFDDAAGYSYSGDVFRIVLVK